jgi:DNA-binding transcriptional MerR regulator
LEEIPDKPYFKVGEVCRFADTQPYVLRFWESEFPQLAARKNRTGQRVYSREDVDLILRIKKLLHEQEYTIADARRVLESDAEVTASAARRVSPAILEPGDWTPAADLETGPAPDSYRASYEAARAEVERLRAAVDALQARCARAEADLAAATGRAERASRRLEALLAEPDLKGEARVR